MKSLTIREARAALTKLDEVLAKEGELVIMRRGEPLARLVPIRPRRRRLPSHETFIRSMEPMKAASETLLREERDAR